MKKKVLIIDDITDRKKTYLSNDTLLQLDALCKEGLLCISSGYKNFRENYKQIVDEYDLIAVHKSYLINENVFNEFVKEISFTNKYLITFTGNNDQNDIFDKGKYVDVTPKEFYKSKLPEFITEFCTQDNFTSPLLQYVYDKSWRLMLLLQYRFLLWKYDDIYDIEDGNDLTKAEELQRTLWNEEDSVPLAEVNKEIEEEINKNKLV